MEGVLCTTQSKEKEENREEAYSGALASPYNGGAPTGSLLLQDGFESGEVHKEQDKRGQLLKHIAVIFAVDPESFKILEEKGQELKAEDVKGRELTYYQNKFWSPKFHKMGGT